MPTLPTLNVLHRAEFPSDYATVMVLIENVHGAPRHTHPGLEMTYILEGEFLCRRGDQAADHVAVDFEGNSSGQIARRGCGKGTKFKPAIPAARYVSTFSEFLTSATIQATAGFIAVLAQP
jgi:hypothetical protein